MVFVGFLLGFCCTSLFRFSIWLKFSNTSRYLLELLAFVVFGLKFYKSDEEKCFPCIELFNFGFLLTIGAFFSTGLMHSLTGIMHYCWTNPQANGKALTGLPEKLLFLSSWSWMVVFYISALPKV